MPAFLYVNHMQAGTCRGQMRAPDALGLELQVTVSHSM